MAEDEKGIIESAVDIANRATTAFLEATKIIPNAEAREAAANKKPTARLAREKQGPGFTQAIVE